MLKQSLEDQMEADTKDLNEEKANKAAAEETKAVAVGDLAETTKFLANSEEVLQTTGTTCMTVAGDHEATMKSRTEELTAIATAKKILSEHRRCCRPDIFVLPVGRNHWLLLAYQ